MKTILPLAGLAAAVAFVAYKSSKGEEPVAKAKDSPKTSSDLSADDQLYADMMKAGADADAKAKADADAKAKADADAKAKADADAKAKADADAKAKADADAKAKAAFDKCLITAKFLVSTPFVYQTAFPSVKGQSIGNWMILLLTSSAATKKDFQSWLVTLKSEFDNRSKVSPDATAKAIYDMGECLALEYQKRFGGT